MRTKIKLKLGLLIWFCIICHLAMSQEANTTIPLPLLNTDTIVQNEIDTIENELVTLKNEKKSKKETITDTSKNCFSCKERSPKQVAFYAAMCPGLGQIYNKKYWKLPIVYAGIGTGVFFISYSGSNLRTFNQALTLRLDNKPETIDQFDGQLDDAQLTSFRDYHRRNIQLAVFGTMAWWGLSIIDATVDAHLKSFDISDDLTMKIKPTLFSVQNSIVPSVNVSLRWK